MVDQLHGMANILWYLLVPVLLLLLLWSLRIWWPKGRALGSSSSQDNRGKSALKTTDVTSSLKIEGLENVRRRHGKSGRQPGPWQERRRHAPFQLGLSECKGWLNTFPPPPSIRHVEGALLTGVVQSGVTSGKLAEMAYRKSAKDPENPTIGQVRQGGRATTTSSPFHPCSEGDNDDDDDVDTTEAEAILVQYYLDADLRSVWKRRAMAFVGQ